MPRDSSGNYSLPGTYNPVLTGTVITSAWANTTLNDIAAALTDSLSRSGKGGMTAVMLIPDGLSGGPGLAFASEQTTGLYRNGASTPTFVVNGVPVWSCNANRQFLLNAIDNQASEIINDTSPLNGFTISYQHSGTEIGHIGTGPFAAAGSAINDFALEAVSGTIRIATLAAQPINLQTNGNNSRIVIDSNGLITINTPAAVGSALTVNGIAGASYALKIVVPNSAGSAFGLSMNAGTNTSDYTMLINNAANTLNYMYILGDGESFIQTPPAVGTPLSGCYQIGYLDAPLHQISASATLGVTDRGKSVQLTGGSGQTLTLPSGMPGGAMILVVNTSGGNWTLAATSLTWLPGGTTGSRTLSNDAIVTCWSTGGSTWYVWGLGIT